MKTMRFAMLAASVVALGACDERGQDAILAPIPPLAYTRFINAVADTSGTDWRFIDQIEYSPVMFNMTFRAFSPYQGTGPGSRRLRVFPTSTDINVTQQHFIDTTLTFEAGKYYTIIHTGYARTGSTPADKILMIEDPIPTSTAATDIAVRSVNLGMGLANQDVYAVATTTTSITGLTPLFANLAYEAASAYSTRALGTMAFRSANTGTTTVAASAAAPAGAAADPNNGLTAIGGATIGGSAFTGFFFPRSVAGSAAPQSSAFTNPAIIFIVDRHPR